MQQKKKVKKANEAGKRITAMRLRLGMDQVPFARFLGVTQSRISEWESGKTTPSAEMYLRLANHASPQDAVWFWKQAGIHPQALELAAGEIVGRRLAPHATGDVARIPRFQLIQHKLEETAPPIFISKEFIPNVAATIAIAGQYGRQVVLVDRSVTELDRLFGRVAAVDSSLPKPLDSSARPAGLITGPLHLDHELADEGIRWFAVLSPESFEATRIAGWLYRKPKTGKWPQWPVRGSDFDLYHRHMLKSQQDALYELQMFEGYSVLGECLAVLFSP